MNQNDNLQLESMRQLISAPIPKGILLAELAEQLLCARDALSFDDVSWYEDLTEQLITLDSAATFRARNEAEQRQLDSAVDTAVIALQKLVAEKQIEPH